MRANVRMLLRAAAIAVVAVMAMLAAGTSTAQTTYTWTGATNNGYGVPTNWSPARNTSLNTDILVFNNSAAVTGMAVQTIGELHIRNGAVVSIQPAGVGTLSITGGASSKDFEIAAGCTFQLINVANILTVQLGGSATGYVEGTLLATNGAQRVTGLGGATLQIASGGIVQAGTGFAGNMFGTAPAHWVTFDSGSKYICQAGGNPFAVSEPGTVVTFMPGSLYSHQSNATQPSYSNRTYGNIEINSPGYSSTGMGAGSLTCGNFNVIAGTQHFLLPLVTIKGNITVAQDQVLDFSTTALTMGGTSLQTISGLGTFSLLTNARLVINNPAGVNVLKPLQLTGGASVVSGGTLMTGVGGKLTIPLDTDLTADAGTTVAISDSLTNSGALNMSGTLRIDSGGRYSGVPPTYTPSSTLAYNPGVSYNTGTEWNVATSVGPGVPQNVTVLSGTIQLGSGNKSCPGNLTLGGGTLTCVPAGNFRVGGNWTAAGGSFVANSRKVTFGGGGSSFLSGATSFASLTVESHTTLRLLSSILVNGQLTLNFGMNRIFTGANSVTVGPAGSVAVMDSGYVVGNLTRYVPQLPTTQSIYFQIGDSLVAAPASLLFSGNAVTKSGYLTAYTTRGDHFDIAHSGIDSTRSLNRTWTVMGDTLTFTSFDATFDYSAAYAERDPGTDPLIMVLRRYLAGTWYATGPALNAAASILATAVTGLGTFQGGVPLIPPVITSVTPPSAGNSGPTTLTIRGTGFAPSATVDFPASAQLASIFGTHTVISSDSTTLTTTVDFTGALPEVTFLEVHNPNGLSAAYGGFTVVDVEAPQLRVNIVGPALIRANRRVPYDLVLENPGNVDATHAPLWLSGIPANATVEPAFAVAAPTRDAGEPDWTTVPLGFTAATGRCVPLVIPRVPPGTSVRRIYLTLPNDAPSFHLRATITPPWADGTVFRSCMTNAGLANTPCMGAQLTAINDSLDASPEIEALNGEGVWAKVVWDCEGANTLPLALGQAEQVLEFMLAAAESGTGVNAACSAALAPRWTDTLIVTMVGSLDPNDKIGTHGLIAINQPVPYSIRFENAHTATAPAQDVVIVDQLDQSKLDLNTVRFSDITFAGRRLIVPPDVTTSYATSVLLNAGLRVDVSMLLDRFTGLLTWSFASIDPATNATPENPLIGFLPPDSTGSVLFTIVPRNTLTGGTQIQNTAAITFDGSAPNNTPPWTYIVDNVPPVSHVLPLVASSSATTIPVGWTADGAPPDLRDFTVYVSEDNAPYRVWRLNTRATSDTLSPPGNRVVHSYKFFSVARDSSGNIEASPGTADASTQSVLAAEGATPALRLELQGARPNPVRNGALRVWFTLPSDAAASIELVDVAGRLVVRREVGSLGAGPHSVALDALKPLRPGLYFIRLAQAQRALTSRVAVMR